jgi:hypothetical protein
MEIQEVAALKRSSDEEAESARGTARLDSLGEALSLRRFLLESLRSLSPPERDIQAAEDRGNEARLKIVTATKEKSSELLRRVGDASEADFSSFKQPKLKTLAQRLDYVKNKAGRTRDDAKALSKRAEDAPPSRPNREDDLAALAQELIAADVELRSLLLPPPRPADGASGSAGTTRLVEEAKPVPDEREAEMTSLRAELEYMRGRLEDATEHQHKGEAEEKEDALASVHRELAENRAELERVRAELTATLSELDGAKAELAVEDGKWQRDEAEAEARVTRLQLQYEQERSEKQTLQARLAGIRSAHLNEIALVRRQMEKRMAKAAEIHRLEVQALLERDNDPT